MFASEQKAAVQIVGIYGRCKAIDRVSAFPKSGRRSQSKQANLTKDMSLSILVGASPQRADCPGKLPRPLCCERRQPHAQSITAQHHSKRRIIKAGATEKGETSSIDGEIRKSTIVAPRKTEKSTISTMLSGSATVLMVPAISYCSPMADEKCTGTRRSWRLHRR